jgi:hypothetical protein
MSWGYVQWNLELDNECLCLSFALLELGDLDLDLVFSPASIEEKRIPS